MMFMKFVHFNSQFSGSRSSVNLILTHTTAASQCVSPLASMDSAPISTMPENVQRTISSRVPEAVQSDGSNKTSESLSDMQKNFDCSKSDYLSLSTIPTSTSSTKEQLDNSYIISSDSFDESVIEKTKSKQTGDIIERDNLSTLPGTSSLADSENISVTSETAGAVDNTSSSCEEGTVMGSSSEEIPLHVSTSASSSYLKNMLADAMTEKTNRSKDQSPISTER